MTNDMTRLNEKIGKSKGMMKEDANIKKESKKALQLMGDKRVMIKSASEPRLLISWSASDLADNDHEAEEIIVDEFWPFYWLSLID